MKTTILAGAMCVAAVAGARATPGYPEIWSFSGGADGGQPRGRLLADAAGNLYGTAAAGGANNGGTVYELSPPPRGAGPATEKTIWSFSGGDGSLPSAGLVADSAGNLYGTTAMDGSHSGGTVFELSPPAAGQSVWTETTLWHFGANIDGKNPVGDLILGPGGVLYGTTNWGGAAQNGTVFALTPPAAGGTRWTEQVIWSFSGGADGAQPVAGLTLDASGALYGTAKLGGASGNGTIFMLTPPAGGQSAWSQSTLWSFTGGGDGAEPSGDLWRDKTGALYGTTIFGGAPGVTCGQSRFPYYGEPESQNQYALNAAYVPAGGNQCGTIFMLTPPAGGSGWSFSTIYQFQGSPDGANPVAGMVMLADGSLYGFTTKYGPGSSGVDNHGVGVYGTSFRLYPPAVAGGAWSLTAPVAFQGTKPGIYPRGAPALSPDGLLFGTMMGGGADWVHLVNFGGGMAFAITP